MSPLVALLAIACAAPLLAHRRKTENIVTLPKVMIPSGIKTAEIRTDDVLLRRNCGSAMVGERVVVCDDSPCSPRTIIPWSPSSSTA